MCSLLKQYTAQKRPFAKSLSPPILSHCFNIFLLFSSSHQPLLAPAHISSVTQTTFAPLLFSLSFHHSTMGNTASNSCIRVISNSGRVRDFARSVRASQLMYENPGHFVCDSSNLKVGCRVPGLAADEQLEANRRYFLLPMDLLYSVLTEEEMALLACRASRKRSGSYIGRRIFPVLSDFCLIPSEAKKVVEEPARWRLAEDGDVEVSRHRSWRPALDTIEEAP